MDKEIKDPKIIRDIINSLFGRLPVTMIVNGKPVPIKIISLNPQGLIIKYTGIKIETDQRILTLTNNGNLLICLFKFLGGDDKGLQILRPLSISIKKATRSSERISMKSSEGSFKIHVTNIISQNDIFGSLHDDSAKVEDIKQKNIDKLSKYEFSQVDVYINERMDNRLRLMQNYDKPIFVPNKLEPHSVTEGFLPYKEYFQLLKLSKSHEKIIGEICIPLKYKNIINIGYIQVLHEEALDPKSFNIVNLVASAIKRELMSSNVFREEKDICELVDLSRDGISFFHLPTRSFNRTISLGGTIFFELVYKEDKKIACRAIVRNIKPLEKHFRVGCQFFSQSPDELKALEEILGPPEESKDKKDTDTKKVKEKNKEKKNDPAPEKNKEKSIEPKEEKKNAEDVDENKEEVDDTENVDENKEEVDDAENVDENKEEVDDAENVEECKEDVEDTEDVEESKEEVDDTENVEESKEDVEDTEDVDENKEEVEDTEDVEESKEEVEDTEDLDENKEEVEDTEDKEKNKK